LGFAPERLCAPAYNGRLSGTLRNPTKEDVIRQIDVESDQRDSWKKKNRSYHEEIETLCKSLIPANSRILEIGCSTGSLLAALNPLEGKGIDISPRSVEIAKNKYPQLTFEVDDAENLQCRQSYDVVILSDLVGYLFDVWSAFRNLRHVTNPGTRVIITYYNALWEPMLLLAERLGLKAQQPHQNWLSLEDIENQLNLNGYEVIRRGQRILIPVRIPLISLMINRMAAAIPFFRYLCLVKFLVAREKGNGIEPSNDSLSCSVIIPCRNEAGNIEEAVRTVPSMGRHTEIIFVDGNSTDGTQDIINRQIEQNRGVKDIKLLLQGSGIGKGDAVRKGFQAATGDILFILDADLTVPPSDLPKFYRAIAENEGELINGTRLVYPMEDEAMRFLNLLANKTFSLIFTWLLDQRIKDTLCGTKVISKKNYESLAANRAYFGDFDPFGDFDLLFGAAKLNLKIVEVPVRYRARTYGDTKISRFSHGWLLLRMCVVALRKFKFS
jgi:SAM-dependent methyltransferase